MRVRLEFGSASLLIWVGCKIADMSNAGYKSVAEVVWSSFSARGRRLMLTSPWTVNSRFAQTVLGC